MLVAGQNLLLNKRLWHLRQVRPVEARHWELEAIGVSEAALGLTRRMTAIQYGDDLFIQQRQRDYWHCLSTGCVCPGHFGLAYSECNLQVQKITSSS